MPMLSNSNILPVTDVFMGKFAPFQNSDPLMLDDNMYPMNFNPYTKNSNSNRDICLADPGNEICTNANKPHSNANANSNANRPNMNANSNANRPNMNANSNANANSNVTMMNTNTNTNSQGPMDRRRIINTRSNSNNSNNSNASQ